VPGLAFNFKDMRLAPEDGSGGLAFRLVLHYDITAVSASSALV
jgi:hypothetical protein